MCSQGHRGDSPLVAICIFITAFNNPAFMSVCATYKKVSLSEFLVKTFKGFVKRLSCIILTFHPWPLSQQIQQGRTVTIATIAMGHKEASWGMHTLRIPHDKRHGCFQVLISTILSSAFRNIYPLKNRKPTHNETSPMWVRCWAPRSLSQCPGIEREEGSQGFVSHPPFC